VEFAEGIVFSQLSLQLKERTMHHPCKHRHDHPGARSFGPDIPERAQGACFPGNEPGAHCRLSGELCANPDGASPDECLAASPTEWLCPECQIIHEDAALWSTGDGAYFYCRDCLTVYTAKELPRAFNSLLAAFAQALLDERQARIADPRRMPDQTLTEASRGANTLQS
jgi:hypothetical protein